MGIVYPPPSVITTTLAPIIAGGSDVGTVLLPFGEVHANDYFGIPEGSGGLTIVTGTEIDTGNTIDSAIIYLKVISFGTLPNSGTKNVAHGITGLLSLVSMDFVFDDGTDYHQGEYHASIQPRTFINGTNIVCITSSSGFITFSGVANIYYTRS